MMEHAITDTPIEAPTHVADKGPIRLIAGLLALAIAAFLTTLAVVLLIPDQNDYAKVSVLKHERMASIEGPKVVLIGGSNLAFGIESDVIESATGCATANMGMNGYFGPRFMLREVRPKLSAGDIVVIAFEWDNFGKSVDGSGKDLLAVAKSNPYVWQFLSPKQQGMAVQSMPFVAQAKTVRVTETLLETVGVIDVSNDEAKVEINDIETVKAFDSKGDLNGHDGLVWDGEYEQGIDIGGAGLETKIVDLIKDFARDMKARDVTVIVSFTPTMASYYDEQQATIDEAYQMLISGDDAVTVPRPPSAFRFDTEYFFDTVYHLKTTTRDIRSQMIADDINSILGTTPACQANTQ